MMPGVVLYNTSQVPVSLPSGEGLFYPGEWRFFEDRRGLTEYLNDGYLVEVEMPGRSANVETTASEAFAAYWDFQAAQEAAEEEAKKVASEERRKSKSSKVRDTDSATNSNTTQEG